MAADFSGCCEFTSGYGNFHYLRDGKFVVTFDFTGNSQERIYGKDSTTATDITNAALFLEELQLNCSSGGSYIGVYDGSAGSELCHPIYCVSDLGAQQVWDFRDNPLVCLTACNTQSLCISATQNGFISGLIKAHWGVA